MKPLRYIRIVIKGRKKLLKKVSDRIMEYRFITFLASNYSFVFADLIMSDVVKAFDNQSNTIDQNEVIETHECHYNSVE